MRGIQDLEPALTALPLAQKLTTIQAWQRIWLWLCSSLCVLSGMLLWGVKQILERDPFSVWYHPLHPWLLALHLLTAPLLVGLGGSLFLTHVIPHFKKRRHAWSGSLLLGNVALFTVSGMFLFFPFPEALAAAVSWVHIASGGVFPGMLGYHWWMRQHFKAGEGN